MKHLALLLFGLLPIPVAAQNFDDVMARIEIAMAEIPGSNRAAIIVLQEEIASARAEGRLEPDWAIFFAMLTDGVRIDLERPAYALQLADEGLALLTNAPDDFFRPALLASRAYALADLGRLAEAARTLGLALPGLALHFDESTMADYRTDVDAWSEGELGTQSMSPIDLARRSLEDASDALWDGAYTKAIVLASAAILPSGPNDGAHRALDARAEMITGHAHVLLERPLEAFSAYRRGLGRLSNLEPQLGLPIAWALPMEGEPRETAFLMLENAATVAVNAQALDVAAWLRDEALKIAQSPAERAVLLTVSAGIAFAREDPQGALETLIEIRAAAHSAGDRESAARADLQTEVLRLSIARDAGQPHPPEPIVVALGTLLDASPTHTHLSTLATTTDALRGMNAAPERLEVARQTLRAAHARLLTAGAGGFADRAARGAIREGVEAFLRAAHDAGESGQDPRAQPANCAKRNGIDTCILVRSR